MRKILLVLLCNFSLSVFAQEFKNGDKLFGGSFSFSVFNTNNSGPTYYNAGNVGILPSYSWFIKNDLAFGIRGNAGYNKSVTKFVNGEKRTTHSFTGGVAVFLKKYKFVKDKFGITLDHETGVNYSVFKEDYPPSIDLKNKSYGANYRFSPGVFYRFTNRFIGEGNIGGAFLSYYGGQGVHSFGVGASFLQQFNLGVNYLLDKKRS